jgi:hypothetical protein
MNATLLKSLIAFLPAVMLIVGAALLFRKDRRASSLLQLLGAASFLVVIFAHVSEALQWFPFIGWGLESPVKSSGWGGGFEPPLTESESVLDR